MLKQQARIKREFIYRRSIEEKEQKRLKRNAEIKEAIASGKKISRELQDDALAINEELDYETNNVDHVLNNEDDEYFNAGKENPVVVVSTSRDPSTKLQEFSKEFRFLIPNAQKINRGAYKIKELVDSCLRHGVTDIVMLNETRGVPDSLQISHLPYGPTAIFSLFNVTIKDKISDEESKGKKCSQSFPHQIFKGLNTKLGLRVRSILKHLFPVPNEESKRLITWFEENDVIRVRHHSYKYNNKQLIVEENGPRFDMKLYKIWRAPLNDEKTAEVEWVFRPYMNTTFKRRFLSEEKKEIVDAEKDDDEE